MALSQTLATSFKVEILDGIHNFGTGVIRATTAADTFKIALYTANATFIVGPTPDANYSAELHYFYYPESIVTAGTSWVGTNFSSALLYGSLLEAYTYMKGEKDVLDNYRARYDEAMLLLKQLGDGKNRQDAYRSGQVRYPVQ